MGVNFLHKIGLKSICGEWGTLHDITGILVYIVAFVVLFSLEKEERLSCQRPQTPEMTPPLGPMTVRFDRWTAALMISSFSFRSSN